MLTNATFNLLQRVVRFFHPRLSCTMSHISADVQRITLNASCMISRGRTKQLDIFCHVTGFMSDFLSFIVVELIWFFHETIPLIFFCQFIVCTFHWEIKCRFLWVDDNVRILLQSEFIKYSLSHILCTVDKKCLLSRWNWCVRQWHVFAVKLYLSVI